MEIKSSVFKRKSGKSKGKWVARIMYVDETGRPREMERSADSKGAATDIKNRLVIELTQSHGHSRTGDKMKFDDLANHCEKHFYKPAVYADGRRVEGVRSLLSARSHMKSLRLFFGKRLLRTISNTTLREYRTHRLGVVSPMTKAKISLTTVNRELTMMRRMINVALNEGWILRNPFRGSESLINAADEKRCERILSRAEEQQLLAACETERRGHLKALIILALDTAMRRGELFKLRWQDVDFENKQICVQATHTKTQRQRFVPLTRRAEVELEKVRLTSSSERIFPFVDIKISFANAKREAGVTDVRFHDLRHTAITRLVRSGMPSTEAGKIAGHTQPQTTYRYINTDADTLRRASHILDSYEDTFPEKQETVAVESFVN
jgi:integrase